MSKRVISREASEIVQGRNSENASAAAAAVESSVDSITVLLAKTRQGSATLLSRITQLETQLADALDENESMRSEHEETVKSLKHEHSLAVNVLQGKLVNSEDKLRRTLAIVS